MKGIIGKKIGMTSIYDATGKSVACTIIEAGPCTVTQVKTPESDGYSAIQIAFGSRKEKNTPKALINHLAKSGTAPAAVIKELRNPNMQVTVGDTIDATLFEEGDTVSVVGTSKGKGFQGVVKRHGFSGVGEASHGQHDRQRAPGSKGKST
jgi:large subunit ribosomal protein L3